ncbi:12896_t:CDS:2 [Funneliformis geosporum]|uniref:5180_t:CDS:1 n=1 Tax=Funneliformis geosporum TaxID=1117311 RepID=A0A9W4WZR2_9GLOM|nr:5180_t:CDS:2 [Funneliformis geosporum]CAI2185000.1 12896_t:CDS:2 [Funneliformis geosporum]
MNPVNKQPVLIDEKDSNYATFPITNKRNNFQLVPNSSSSSSTDYSVTDGNGVIRYIMNPRELRKDHPVWHYFYLCTLIFAAFVSLFIGPVIFGMLAAIGGLATPLVLSLMGGGLGLILGIVFGVVFSVVCIVALVRALGWSAEWVLEALWFGGNDLMEITKEQIFMLISPPRHQQD